MTLLEFKKITLGLIEELNPNSTALTDDPDIGAKINAVINQVMFELARMKKIPEYVEFDVTEGDVVTFNTIGEKCGKKVYQVGNVGGVKCSVKANGTVFKMLESGMAEIDCYVYPTEITEDTADSYEFDLTPDVLGIMPYGVAADLLKSDVSANYGQVYSARYESMKQMLDPRYQMTSITIDGGITL